MNPDSESPEDEAAPRREPVFNLPAVIVGLIAACVALHALRSYVLSDAADIWLIRHFAFVPIDYSGLYQADAYLLVAPLSYAFLHGTMAHLLVNMIWLAAFGSPLANRLGAARFLAFWVATGIASVALHYVLHRFDAIPLVGASGAISGMMGAAARFGFRIDRQSGRAAFAGPVLPVAAVFRSRATATFLVVWLAINLLMAFGFGASDDGGRIAWEAHIGGFLLGFFAVRLFDPPYGRA